MHSDKLVMLLVLGCLILAGIMFARSLLYGLSRNNKWLMFMASGLVMLSIASLALAMLIPELERKLLRNLIMAELFFLSLAVFLFVTHWRSKNS